LRQKAEPSLSQCSDTAAPTATTTTTAAARTTTKNLYFWLATIYIILLLLLFHFLEGHLIAIMLFDFATMLFELEKYLRLFAVVLLPDASDDQERDDEDICLSKTWLHFFFFWLGFWMGRFTCRFAKFVVSVRASFTAAGLMTIVVFAIASADGENVDWNDGGNVGADFTSCK
jgi:hypothetical protein